MSSAIITARSVQLRDALSALAFLAPFLVFYIVFLIYPFGLGVWISFHDWELVGSFREWVGLWNYEDMFADPQFWRAVRNTLTFAAMTVPVMVGLALLLALGLNRQSRIHGALRAIFFTSNVLSVTVVTLVWIMVLSFDRGLISPLLRAVGLEPIAFLASTTWAMPAIVATTVWWGIGFPMILFLAGLQQIPGELYEAAKLDNASPWRRFTRITLPALRRTLVLVAILQVIGQLQIFGQVLIMTGGGPSQSTRSLVQTIYETGFADWRLGYASAMSLFLFVIMFVASMAQLYIARKED